MRRDHKLKVPPIRSLPLPVLKQPAKVGALYACQLFCSRRDSPGALAKAFLLVPLDKPDRRPKKIKLFAQTILQMTQEREMQTAFAARAEHDKRWRPHARLRHVLDVQTRPAVTPGGHGAAPFDHAPVNS